MGPRNRRDGSSGDDDWRRPTTANRPRVLLVDDEASIRTNVGRGLEALGYDIVLAVDGKDGLEQLERWRPEVILMDLAMPRMGGLTAIELVRQWSTIPIIVVSVMGEEGDKVRALEAGADDYVTKPFGLSELNARIRVALRHKSRLPGDQPLELGDLTIDIGKHLVLLRGDPVHLTPIEYELLKQLGLNAGRLMTHQTLLANVWGSEHEAEKNYLRPVITSLRKKLGSHVIHTEPGVGYRLTVE